MQGVHRDGNELDATVRWGGLQNRTNDDGCGNHSRLCKNFLCGYEDHDFYVEEQDERLPCPDEISVSMAALSCLISDVVMV